MIASTTRSSISLNARRGIQATPLYPIGNNAPSLSFSQLCGQRFFRKFDLLRGLDNLCQDSPVQPDCLVSLWCNACPSSTRAARTGLNECDSSGQIHCLNQFPCPSIRHFHFPGGG